MKKSRQLFVIIGIVLIGLAGCKKNNSVEPEENDLLIGKWNQVKWESEFYGQNGKLLDKTSKKEGDYAWSQFWQEFRPQGVMYESQSKDPIKWSRKGDIIYRIWGDKEHERDEYNIIRLTSTELVTKIHREGSWGWYNGEESEYSDHIEYFERVQ